MKHTGSALGAVTLAGLLLLSGCGSDDAATDSSAGRGESTTATGAPSGAPGGFDRSELKKIQQCLEAAGLDDAFPTDVPTDMPTDVPSELPTDMPSNAPGGGFGALQDPEVQDALAACGIDLPEAPAS